MNLIVATGNSQKWQAGRTVDEAKLDRVVCVGRPSLIWEVDLVELDGVVVFGKIEFVAHGGGYFSESRYFHVLAA